MSFAEISYLMWFGVLIIMLMLLAYVIFDFIREI